MAGLVVNMACITKLATALLVGQAQPASIQQTAEA
jgi:hypothetical protein